jgi:spermine oxidase
VETISLHLYGEVGPITGGQVIVPRGVSTIVQALKEDMGSSQYELNRVVEGIDWTEDGVTVSTESNVYSADHVIATIPLGVLQTRPELFSPPLDNEKRNAIQNMSPGRCSKIFLQYDTPFWKKGDGQIVFVWTKEEQDSIVLPEGWYKTIGFVDEVEGNHDKLLVWVVGDAAVVADQIEESEVAERITDIFHRFTGNLSIPLPAKVIRHPFLTDPFSMGTFSHPTLDTTSSDYTELSRALPADDLPRLLLAGEHVHDKYWSSMHGAMLTGIQQAEKVIWFRLSDQHNLD